MDIIIWMILAFIVAIIWISDYDTGRFTLSEYVFSDKKTTLRDFRILLSVNPYSDTVKRLVSKVQTQIPRTIITIIIQIRISKPYPPIKNKAPG